MALSIEGLASQLDGAGGIWDGYWQYEQLRSRGYTKPIFALTGHRDGPEADRALSSGCDALLAKPIHSDVLKAHVQSVLQGSGARA